MNNNELEDISEDTDNILEDTSSIDKKTTLLIILWIADKIIMLGMFILIGKFLL